MRKSHVKQVLCTNPWPCPSNGIVYARLRIHNDSRFHINVKVIPLFFMGHVPILAEYGILGWKTSRLLPWASSIHNNNNNNNNNSNNNNNIKINQQKLYLNKKNKWKNPRHCYKKKMLVEMSAEIACSLSKLKFHNLSKKSFSGLSSVFFFHI